VKLFCKKYTKGLTLEEINEIHEHNMKAITNQGRLMITLIVVTALLILVGGVLWK